MVVCLFFEAQHDIQQCLKLSYFFFKCVTSMTLCGFSCQVRLYNANTIQVSKKKKPTQFEKLVTFISILLPKIFIMEIYLLLVNSFETW